MRENSDKRSELRIPQQVMIYIETHASPDGDSRPINIVISRTLDLSANGLQVVMDKPLNLGSILRLGVELRRDEAPERFILSAEVRWVAKTGDKPRYFTGFSLLESEGTDIVAWKYRMADLFGEKSLPAD